MFRRELLNNPHYNNFILVNEETSYEKWGGLVHEYYVNWTHDRPISRIY